MIFTNEIPSHTIDLKKPEADRWDHVIRKEKRAATQLINKMAEIDAFPEWSRPFRDAIIGKAYEWAGGLYHEELASWGEGLGISTGTMTALNCNYEASHMMCSAAIVNTARGPIHIRAMDWDISGLGSATRKFWFKNGSRKFLAIGVLGHVGVVSGMLPGRYSITINWAPPTDRVDPRDYGPTFLLRDVFETCDTYGGV